MVDISGVGVAVADEEPSVIFFFFLEASDLVFWVCLPFIESFKVGALLSVKTRWRAATGNTRSREAPGTAGGPWSLDQWPEIRHTSWHPGC
jgi:hypothetical protein